MTPGGGRLVLSQEGFGLDGQTALGPPQWVLPGAGGDVSFLGSSAWGTQGKVIRARSGGTSDQRVLRFSP